MSSSKRPYNASFILIWFIFSAALFALFAYPFFNIVTPVAAQPQMAPQAIIFVNSNLDELVPGNGACTLREAINNANTNSDTTAGDCFPGAGNDQIFLSALGTIFPITIGGAGDDANLSGDFDITDNLIIDGGNPASRIIDAGGLDRVFHILSGNVTLNGVTITGGNAIFGGGIYNTSALTVTFSTITNNSATLFGGGGIANIGGTLRLDVNSSINNNNAVGSNGGGIGNDSTGLIFISNSNISSNNAGNGGGLSNSNSSSMIIQNSTFANNSATGSGGAFYNDSAVVILDNSIVTTNTADFGGAMYHTNAQFGSSFSFFGGNIATNAGGAIFHDNSAALLNSPIIFNNESQNNDGGGFVAANLSNVTINGGGLVSNIATLGNGGGAVASNSAITLTRAAIVSNTAAGFGAGIALTGSAANIDNSTLSSNVAADGGAIDSDSSVTTLVNVTIANNSPNGAALRNGSTLNLANSILAANGGVNCTNTASFLNSVGYNIEDANSCNLIGPGDAPATDPQLEPLANNGGSTWTHAILPNTPAYNSIPAGISGCGTAILLDQRNMARPQNGSCEAGAYEKALIYVDKDATGSANGSSWTDAINNLQNALMFAPANSEIWVADGAYYPDLGFVVTNDDRNTVFMLRNNIELYGGFAATETQRIERDWLNNPTVLSGDIDNETMPDLTNSNGVVTDVNNILGNNSYTVINASGTNSSAILDGFMVTAGLANGAGAFPSPERRGGGFYMDSGSPTLSNLLIQANAAPGTGSNGFGGGMYMLNDVLPTPSSPFLNNVTFDSNVASNDGGGSYQNTDSNPTFNLATFQNNDSGARGGGLYKGSSSITIFNSTFFNNSAQTVGGGIYSRFGTTTLVSTAILSNTANWGGGLYDWNNSTIITGTLIDNNHATIGGGGGTYTGRSTFTVQNSIFSNNRSGFQCAAINNEDSTVAIDNSYIVSNTLTTGPGGGICNLDVSSGISPTLILSRTTIAANTTPGLGGAIYSQGAADGYTVYLSNSTLAGNSALSGGGMYNVGMGQAAAVQTTINNNMVSNDGGGIKNVTSTLLLLNSTVSMNSASDEGGGIWNNSLLALTHVTVASNTAVISGGGLFNTIGSTPLLTSTLIAYSGNADCAGLTPFSLDYNVDSDSSCLFSQPNDMPMSDPLLSPLADNGGDTLTHAVPSFSPLIDRIPPGANGCGTTVANDQRDVSREQASGCESGAYEFFGNSAPIANIDVYATGKNDPLVITNTGVLSNDLDLNNDPITVTIYTAPNFGTVVVQPSGSFVFTPANGFIGRASFFYTMTDGIDTGSAKVVIDVYEVVATLGIDDGGSGIVKLAWNTDSTVCDYKVYRNTSPYGSFSLVAVIPASNDYDDPGAIGDPGTNYYYYVEASCLGAHYFNNTNKTGEFDFGIQPGG